MVAIMMNVIRINSFKNWTIIPFEVEDAALVQLLVRGSMTMTHVIACSSFYYKPNLTFVLRIGFTMALSIRTFSVGLDISSSSFNIFRSATILLVVSECAA